MVMVLVKFSQAAKLSLDDIELSGVMPEPLVAPGLANREFSVREEGWIFSVPCLWISRGKGKILVCVCVCARRMLCHLNPRLDYVHVVSASRD